MNIGKMFRKIQLGLWQPLDCFFRVKLKENYLCKHSNGSGSIHSTLLFQPDWLVPILGNKLFF